MIMLYDYICNISLNLGVSWSLLESLGVSWSLLESLLNALKSCDLSERTIRRAVCQLPGTQKNPETHTKLIRGDLT
jgi:hypothetical protein